MLDGDMKQIMCSDWLPERARWAHLARSELLALIPHEKNKLFGTDFHTFVKSQKGAEDSHSKENTNDSRWFLCYKRNVAALDIMNATLNLSTL